MNNKMQKKRNIKLIILLVLVVLSAISAYFFTEPGDKLKVSRDIFSYNDPANVDKVVFDGHDGQHILSYVNGQWRIDSDHMADPQRVSVLFAILKQMRVRREVSRQQSDMVTEKFKAEGTHVKFYEGDNLVHDFHAWGDEQSSLTYLTDSPEDQAYIIEIPGYKSFLAGIFQLDKNGWRNPIVFDMNWANLSQVKVAYPKDSLKGFTVTYQDQYYNIKELTTTDSVKLTDFLDDISLLYANDFLSKKELEEYKALYSGMPQAIYSVSDVGSTRHTLEIYEELPKGKEIIGRIDSLDYAVFDIDKVRKITKPRSYYIKKDSDDIK